MIDQQHAKAALAGDRGAVQSRRAGADDDRVEAQPFHTNGNATCLKKPFGT